MGNSEMKSDSGTGQYRDRNSQRTQVQLNTQLRHANWYEIEVSVRDVSQSGFMAECDASVQIGSYVSLDVPGIGPVHAQVRWQLGGKMGGMFLDPISLSRCEWTGIKAAAPRVA
jgi:hypothetical protein